ncbi:MAG: hypothetical protein LAP39_03820 [Acidobacteriia bacterium]|nr:hypothetical protein [Terriglobia bacterium]
MKKVEREAILLQLWLQRPQDKRTGNDVLIFYGEIFQTRPELLHPKRYGDPYEELKVTLARHIRELR